MLLPSILVERLHVEVSPVTGTCVFRVPGSRYSDDACFQNFFLNDMCCHVTIAESCLIQPLHFLYSILTLYPGFINLCTSLVSWCYDKDINIPIGIGCLALYSSCSSQRHFFNPEDLLQAGQLGHRLGTPCCTWPQTKMLQRRVL